MKLLFLAFVLLFALGQLGVVSVGAGVRVSALDALVFLLLAGYVVSKGRGGRRPELWLPSLAFVVSALFSLILNRHRLSDTGFFLGLGYLARWALYAASYWVLAAGSGQPQFSPGMLFASGGLVAAGGLIQYFLYPDLRNLYYLGWDPHYQRLFSTLLDPNFAGIVLVLTFLVGLFLREKARARNKALFTLSLVGVGVALLLTYSRSSYLAFLGGLLTWGLITRGWRAVGGIVGIFLIILLLLPKAGEGRNLARFASTLARWENWQEGLEFFRSSPLIGHGFYALAEKRGLSPEANIPARAGAVIDNSLLFVAATTGVIGLSAYVWLIAKMVTLAVKLYKERDRLGTLLLSTLGSIVVHSQFVNSLFYPWVMLWLWVLVGASERKLTQHSRKTEVS